MKLMRSGVVETDHCFISFGFRIKTRTVFDKVKAKLNRMKKQKAEKASVKWLTTSAIWLEQSDTCACRREIRLSIQQSDLDGRNGGQHPISPTKLLQAIFSDDVSRTAYTRQSKFREYPRFSEALELRPQLRFP